MPIRLRIGVAESKDPYSDNHSLSHSGFCSAACPCQPTRADEEGIGVLRLRCSFAKRSHNFAQDDTLNDNSSKRPPTLHSP